MVFAGLGSIVSIDPETDTLWFLLGIGLLISGIYNLYKHYKNKRPNSKSTIDYLNERYAKGEITEDEYYIIRKDLGLE